MRTYKERRERLFKREKRELDRTTGKRWRGPTVMVEEFLRKRDCYARLHTLLGKREDRRPSFFGREITVLARSG